MSSETASSEQKFVKQDLKIPSKIPGWNLDGWKYLPKNVGSSQSKGLPVIVMAHGVSANKLMGLAQYAEEFASLGYGVVVFDYRRWGTSDGKPRHVVYVSEQLEDYRTVIKFVRQQPEFDPQRVVLWGTSFAGGHVVTLASEKELNLTAVISQCPYLGQVPVPPMSWGFAKTVLKGVADVLKQAAGLGPVYMPAAAQPGGVGLMTAPGSYEGLFGIVKQEGAYPNEVNASSLFEFPFYNPNATGAKVACPVKVIAPKEDNLCPYNRVEELARLSSQVEVHTVAGGHFEVYPGMPHHPESLAVMKEFLLQRVPPS
ncbi:alpha/beta-hydrolase [Lentinus tigrinus ALCF2SS1-7]|uniref:Alpha/beta-hydrolase n=1 Tax=Lentinus tigrinus ALCF2SS1-6 TaxID=1328759 RepID=A0A5C2SBY6_9APHY|nr:alpha/beta-hydrolase [Lentinus tigrinus ALCF2SS1-6]RPD75276.1 alpha/beta-hydrolase [Lentinus tigrinus ALCF2SS1-7]